MQDTVVFSRRLVAHVNQVDLYPLKRLVDRSHWSLGLVGSVEDTSQAMRFDPMALLSLDIIEFLVDGMKQQVPARMSKFEMLANNNIKGLILRDNISRVWVCLIVLAVELIIDQFVRVSSSNLILESIWSVGLMFGLFKNAEYLVIWPEKHALD